MKGMSMSWILSELYDFDLDLIRDLDLGFFKVKFQSSCISGIVGLIDVKQKNVNQSDTGLTTRPCPWTTPMTLTLKFQGQSLK